MRSGMQIPHGASDAGRGRAMAGVLGICVLLLPAAVPAESLHDWQSLGRGGGVEAWSTQTPDGTVRILFRNTNRYPVSIQVARTLIWCGSRVKGEGEALEADIGAFQLRPAQSRSSQRWSRNCRKPDYYVEFRGIGIEPQE